eukprot:7777120-Ditylum_brightwellii.AAC.1
MADHIVRRAMNSLRPIKKRLLIKLVNQGHEETMAAKLLTRRVGTLLKREMIRITQKKIVQLLSLSLTNSEQNKAQPVMLSSSTEVEKTTILMPTVSYS